MKNISLTIALSSIVLFSCGGSSSNEGTTNETPIKASITSLLNTNWEKECSPYNKLSSNEINTLWNVKTRLSIDSSLKSTYKTTFFRPTDTACDAMVFDSLDISKFEITDNITSDESIEAFGLNETFIYHSDSLTSLPSYTLIYIDSEKLYFGQKSGSNTGKTLETRHSSISLDNYFRQIINE